MAYIHSGNFRGNDGKVVAIDDTTVTLLVTLFGRELELQVSRDEVRLDEEDPGPALRRRIEQDQARFVLREEAGFWRALVAAASVGIEEGDPLEERSAYAAHCAEGAALAKQRRDALLAAFDALVASVPPSEVQAAVEGASDRWFIEETEQARLKAEWRADPATFEEFKSVSQRAQARRDRAERAHFASGYLAWRGERWSQEEYERRRAAAEAELAEMRPLLEARFQETWGLRLPESLFRFWLFWRALQEIELEVLALCELSMFGIMDLFDDPSTPAQEGLDVRMHGRFYRDPPEMLTFMHGGTDGLHYGLFYEDGESSAGVVRYYNNDGGGLGLPHGTPLMAVRSQLERVAENLAYDIDAEGTRERTFSVYLVREAVMRFETSERPEHGTDYEAAQRGEPWVNELQVNELQAGSTRYETLDEAGALVGDEVTRAAGHRPLNEAAFEDRRSRIGDDDAVLEWVAEAKRQLEAGDPREALCLGRDLHWCSAGERAREDLACELLAGAYRALGRDALAEIVEAHHRQRDLRLALVLVRA